MPSGLNPQNGLGQKGESQRRVNQPALILLLSLKVPEAYGSRQGKQKVHNKHPGLFGAEEASRVSNLLSDPRTYTPLALKAKEKTKANWQTFRS